MWLTVLECLGVCLCRGKERKNASYSDVPFFGLRTAYYLVSCAITVDVLSNAVLLYKD